MTLKNFSKIAVVSAAICSFAAVAGAQTQAQSYQQQQAYYRAWQQYYQQYYGQNYPQQPAYQSQRGYTTTQPQRAGAWYGAQQPAPAPDSQPDEEYPVVKTHLDQKSAQSVDLDSRQSIHPAVSNVDNSSWYNSFEPAWKSAQKQGRPLVLLFVHHGCPECDKMDGYLAQPGAMDTLASAVKARIEFSDNAATVHRFGIKYTPTFLVISPQGTEAYREIGALDVNRLRQIQPALDSLVTAPPKASAANATKSSEVQNEVSYAPGSEAIKSNDTASSQTIASL